MQQKWQGDRGSELWAGGQCVRSVSEQCISAVTWEYERDAITIHYSDAAGTVRTTEIHGIILAAIVTASVVRYRVHRQRYYIRQLRPIIPWPCKMPSLYLCAMGRTLKRLREKSIFACRESKISDTWWNTMTDVSVGKSVLEAFHSFIDTYLLDGFWSFLEDNVASNASSIICASSIVIIKLQ